MINSDIERRRTAAYAMGGGYSFTAILLDGTRQITVCNCCMRSAASWSFLTKTWKPLQTFNGLGRVMYLVNHVNANLPSLRIFIWQALIFLEKTQGIAKPLYLSGILSLYIWILCRKKSSDQGFFQKKYSRWNIRAKHLRSISQLFKLSKKLVRIIDNVSYLWYNAKWIFVINRNVVDDIGRKI